MKALLSILMLCILSAAFSQDSLKLYQLAEVVITGETEPQSVEKSVYNVRTISMERLKTQGATRVQDVLNTELNIRFSQDLALGGSNLSMMGLPGQNVKVLIDGVPLIGRQGTGNEINLNQINVNSIDRIEIVEGPMAVIYGADALAGVINIITKKTPDGTLDLGANLHEETTGNEYGTSKGIHNQSVNFGYRYKSIYTSGSINHYNFRGWKGDSIGREMEWHPKEQWTGAAVAGYTCDKLNVYYRADYLHEKIFNPSQFKGNEAIDQNYITKRLMHQIQLNTKLSKKLSFTSAVSYTDFERRTQSIAIDKKTGKETLANSSLQNIDQFSGITIRGSLPYKISDHTTLQLGYDINGECGSGTRLKEGNNSIGDYAAFVSADLQISSVISIRPGFRVIHNTVYEAPPLVPSINTKLTISKRHDLRFSYGRGFRAPSLRELYFNFFDASHSIEGNPDLKAELSHSFNASWNARFLENSTWKLNNTLTAFYNDVENMIGYGTKPGSSVTTYLNIDRYKSQGVTLTNTLRGSKAEFRVGFAYTGRYNDLTEHDETLPEFTWSPEVNGAFSYHFTKELAVSVFYKYTGKTPAYIVNPEDNAIVLGTTSGYHWTDVTVQKSFFKYLTLSAGVRNLFDVTRVRNSSREAGLAHSDSGAMKPISYGRSYFISLSFQLTQ